MYLLNSVIEKMVSHARRDFPNEACGIIGVNQHSQRVVPLPNVHPNPSSFFLFDTTDYIQCLNRLDDDGYYFYAVYHSHPRTPAYPSRSDIDYATEDAPYHVIISASDDIPPVVNTYRIMSSGSVYPVPLYRLHPDR